MRRRRFYVERFTSGVAELRGEAAEHLARVLRAAPGQLCELSDGEAVWLARVEEVERIPRRGAKVKFSLLEPVPFREPPLPIQLLLSLVKFDRFEWCLEKAAELGVQEIVPLGAARSEKGLLSAAPKRAGRWRKILAESAQQARRLRPPELRELLRPERAFTDASTDALRILLSERREVPSLKKILVGQISCVSLAIGPEGGWTEKEVEAARRAGFLGASLGENILRTETAVVAALAVVNYALGE